VRGARTLRSVSLPLLRYTLSFGLSVHDAEEVTRKFSWRCSATFAWGVRARICALDLPRGAQSCLEAAHRESNFARSHWANENVVEAHLDPSPNPEENLVSASAAGACLPWLKPSLNSTGIVCGCALKACATGDCFRSRHVVGASPFHSRAHCAACSCGREVSHVDRRTTRHGRRTAARQRR